MPEKPKPDRKKGTSSSSFGSSGRINHDSSRFYSSRMYAESPKETAQAYLENALDPHSVDQIFVSSSERMVELPDNSVHLMVPSPPYNAGKDYDEDLSLTDYIAFLMRVMAEVYRVLVHGGRACINIANLGRRPYIPIHAPLAKEMIDMGFLMRGEIIWDKGSSAGSSTAWGSWLSPTNPILRDTHEYILVFSKGSFKRQEQEGRLSTITRDQFLEYTKSVWDFPAESATRIGHPAPFPVELPHRLIQLYTFSREVVLDPFMGSGQTAIAALKAGRNYVGYELDQKYASLARKRIFEIQSTELAPKLFDLPVEQRPPNP